MSTLPHLNHWLSLSNDEKRDVFLEIADNKGYQPHIIEKDWWVVHTLALIFDMPCGPHLVFKGGTSLSKGWGLIDRFSEDIDLAIDRSHIDPKYADCKYKNQLSNLRKASYKYIHETFVPELRQKFADAQLVGVQVEPKEVEDTDTDPLVIEVYTPKLMGDPVSYLRPEVLIEVGSRSLREPFEPKPIQSWIAEQMPSQPFADPFLEIPTVLPIRTLWEKILLLHEEFCKPADKWRVNRLSRHLYDIYKLSRSEHGPQALEDTELYQTIVEHRQRYTPVKGVDYDTLVPAVIRFLPPKEVMKDWERDYVAMQQMIVDPEMPGFAQLMEELGRLQGTINALDWQIK